jgi:hypothetical protein
MIIRNDARKSHPLWYPILFMHIDFIVTACHPGKTVKPEEMNSSGPELTVTKIIYLTENR